MDEIRQLLYKIRRFQQGEKVIDADQVEINASSFNGNLDSNTTDLQLLAQAVDNLNTGGTGNTPLEFSTFDNGYSGTLASGSISAERFVTFSALPNTSGSNHSSLQTDTTRIEIDEDGLYDVSANIIIQNDSTAANQRLVPDVTLYINGVAESTESHYIRTTTSATDPNFAPDTMQFKVDFIKALSDGDVVRLSVQARTGSVSTLAEVTSSTTVVRKIEASGTVMVTGTTDAENVLTTGATFHNLLLGAGNVEEALERIDATGLGAPIHTFTGNYATSTANRAEWLNRHLQGADGQSCSRNRTVTLPTVAVLNEAFDHLVTLGLSEVLTITVSYFGCSSTSSLVNSLRVNPAVSQDNVPGGFGFPNNIVLNRADSVVLQIERNGGTVGSWTVLRRGLVTTESGPSLDDWEFQDRTWSNRDGSFLPSSDDVLKGYAFRVVASQPNDGTLRQGLVDAGVTDKVIYDGDWVVWTADTFTSWTNGDDWFVSPQRDVKRFSEDASNFHEVITEVDNPVDTNSEDDGAADALIWITNEDGQNAGILTAAPFLTPTQDTGNNPGGNTYIGGRELQNSDNEYVFNSPFGNPLSTGLLYVAVSTAYISQVGLANIFIQRFDQDGTRIAEYSLNDNFVADIFTANSTGRYFVYSQRKISDSFSEIRTHSGETFKIVTRTQDRHFTLNSTRVNLTNNIFDLPESKLSQPVQAKLNKEISLAPIDRRRLDSIEASSTPVALPNNFAYKVKFGEPSATESDYRDWNNSNGLLQDFTSTNVYTIRVHSDQTLTAVDFTGTGTVTLTEITPSLFDNEKTYRVSIPPAPDNINYNPLDHPIGFTGTQDNIQATGLTPNIKVDADNFEQAFLDSITNVNQDLPAPLEALNTQAEVRHFSNTDFASNNDHSGIEAMFAFLKNRPDERLGDTSPTDNNLTNEITNSEITGTIDDRVGLFYPRTIANQFDNGVAVTTQNALVGPGAVNEPVNIINPNASNFRLTLGFWFDIATPIPDDTIRNLIRVKEHDSNNFRRLFGIEGLSRINSNSRSEHGAVVTERISRQDGGTSTRQVTHNLYTTNGEINHTFSGVGASETLFRVNEARTYTFESRLISNGNDEGSSTNQVTITNINQNQSFGTHDFVYTVNGHSHTQQVTIEYVAASSTYGGPGHTLRFELLNGLADNSNFDIDHLIVSCHYETTETVSTATTYAEANAGGTPLIRENKKHRAIFSFRKSASNDNLECHYVMTGFDDNNNPIVSQSNIVDFRFSVFELDWSQIKIGSNSSVIQNVQGYFLNTDTPLDEFPTHAILNGWISSHDTKATDYVWDNAAAPSQNVEVVYFPENVNFPNLVFPSPNGDRWRISVNDAGAIVTTKII